MSWIVQTVDIKYQGQCTQILEMKEFNMLARVTDSPYHPLPHYPSPNAHVAHHSIVLPPQCQSPSLASSPSKTVDLMTTTTAKGSDIQPKEWWEVICIHNVLPTTHNVCHPYLHTLYHRQLISLVLPQTDRIY